MNYDIAGLYGVKTSLLVGIFASSVCKCSLAVILIDKDLWTYLLYSFTCVTEYVYIACVSVIHAIRNKNNFLKCPSCFGKGSNYHWTSSHFWIHMGEGTFNIYSYTYYKCWRGKGVGG